MYKISEILSYITDIAPLYWQEAYDNCGLVIGDANAMIDKVLIAVDITEEVIDEAIENSYHLIISHHPLIFKGIKNILSDNTFGRIIIKAVKNDIAIAAMHTNLDNSFFGVNRILAEKLGLKQLRILHSNNDFISTGININSEILQVGSGMIGVFEEAMSETDFLCHLKKTLNIDVLRHSKLLNKSIKTVALCGGAGSFLINDAKHCKADVYITADMKYHDFFDADNEILLVDAGHFETEQFTKELIADIISKKNPKFAVKISSVKTNSVHYFV